MTKLTSKKRFFFQKHEKNDQIDFFRQAYVFCRVKRQTTLDAENVKSITPFAKFEGLL